MKVVSVVRVIVAWMLHSDPQIVPIIAAREPWHIDENVGGVDLSLSKEQMEILDTASNPDVKNDWLR